MISALKRGIAVEVFALCDSQLSVRAIWSSMFKLVIRRLRRLWKFEVEKKNVMISKAYLKAIEVALE
jgi:hypothetical protein